MSAERANVSTGEWAQLREQVAALEKRIAMLEAANPGAAAALAGMKANVNGSASYATDVAKIPWLVISAAVAAVVKKPFRIAGIEMQGLPPLNVWAFEGRRAIFYSHAVRPN